MAEPTSKTKRAKSSSSKTQTISNATAAVTFQCVTLDTGLVHKTYTYDLPQNSVVPIVWNDPGQVHHIQKFWVDVFDMLVQLKWRVTGNVDGYAWCRLKLSDDRSQLSYLGKSPHETSFMYDRQDACVQQGFCSKV